VLGGSRPELDALVGVRSAGHWRVAWRRFRRDKVAVASAAFVAFVVFAIFPGAPLAGKLLGHGPNAFFPYAVDANLRPSGPGTIVPDTPLMPETHTASGYSLVHPPPPPGTGKALLPLGADGTLGRDELLRLLYGGRVSLEVAFGATLLALLIGLVLGSTAAYFGGWIDSVISRFTDLVMAFPLLLFVIMLGSTVSSKFDHITLHGLFNEGVLSLVGLIGLFTWFYPARIVRAQILSLRGREFVEAAAMTGARDTWIMRRHLFPHLVPPLVVYATLMLATNILLEAGITFLGVGIKLPTASWGNLLATTWGTVLSPSPYNPRTVQPWLTILPSAAIFLSVLSLNQFGEGLREALDPRGVRR
jgi:peptide/nickel transport system permease protein